jgi:hypothetical protein
VFRDRSLGTRIRVLEGRAKSGDEARDVLEAIGQAVRARYETGGDPSAPRDAATLSATAPVPDTEK